MRPPVKVSIIVPCYNMEEYLCDCLDSILVQTFRDFEVICINDGSTDQTLKILTEYSEEDSRVSVYSQDNCGLSISRNNGMDRAQGEYILFVDGDDKLCSETLAELVSMAERCSLDHIAFKAHPFPHDAEVAQKLGSQLEAFRRFYDIPVHPEFLVPQSGAQLMVAMQETAHFTMSTPLHFMKLSVLRENNLRFKSGIIHEDCIFSVDAMLAAKRAVFVDTCYYLRRVRGGSIMTASGQVVEHLVGWVCTLVAHMETLLLKLPDDTTARALELFLGPIFRQISRVRLSKEEESAFQHEVFKHVSPAMMPMVRTLIVPMVGVLQIRDRGVKSTGSQREVEALKRSEAYRVGMAVTYPARKIKGGVECLRENGFWYTVKHALGKVLRCVGVNVKW
ncbi:MAG: glycosyltransferase [Lentisphaerae bacterium]|nr:glycosyltransferase [Lentisphaerota bacterium]